MRHLQTVLADSSGQATPILAVFLLLSVAVGVLAWTTVTQVQAAQRQTQAALAFALRAAAVDGTTVLSDGSFLVGQATALAAAQQAVPVAMPVSVEGLTPSGATYKPTSSAPATWGTLTLSAFTVGNPAQPPSSSICYGSSPPLSSCPYVQATLSLPYSVTLFGYPINLTCTVIETQVIDTYDSQTQTFQQ